MNNPSYDGMGSASGVSGTYFPKDASFYTFYGYASTYQLDQLRKEFEDFKKEIQTKDVKRVILALLDKYDLDIEDLED